MMYDRYTINPRHAAISSIITSSRARPAAGRGGVRSEHVGPKQGVRTSGQSPDCPVVPWGAGLTHALGRRLGR